MTNGLRFARWAWVIAAGAAIALVIIRLGDVWSEARTIRHVRPEYFYAVGHFALSPSQLRALDDLGLSPQWYAALVTVRLVLVAATAVGIAALLWRRAATWAPLFLAWFLLVGLMLTAMGDTAEVPDWLILPVLVLTGGGMISMFGLLLVFPDDRSARWLIGVLVGASIVPLYAIVTDNEAINGWLWHNAIYVAGAMLAAGLMLQITRIVRSRDRTARDLLLLTVGMLVVLTTLSAGSDSWSGIERSRLRAGLGSLAWRLGYESVYMAVPLIYGLAVLWILVRRGHWDMDVQLKGSVGYAGLTTFLVLGYFGIVAVVQAVVNDVSGAAGNTFAIMVSTAVIAAAFLPARSGLQRLVDRIFDRRRRDAEIMVQAFETSVVRDSRPDEVAGAPAQHGGRGLPPGTH